MTLALLSNASMICPQCGDDWCESASGGPRLEYCPRCGSPVTAFGFDPLRAPVYGGGGGLRINSRAKLVVRSGVLVLGMISWLTGAVLLYAGWFSPGAMDVIQLWVSRFGGPLLVAQGLFYSWLPFRHPTNVAAILPFDRQRG